MKASNFNFNLIKAYFDLLRNLSPDNKQELISKLKNSLKKQKPIKDDSLNALYGAFISRKSADQLIHEGRKSRNFIRRTEKL